MAFDVNQEPLEFLGWTAGLAVRRGSRYVQ
jgi:hypothetical protein